MSGCQQRVGYGRNRTHRRRQFEKSWEEHIWTTAGHGLKKKADHESKG